MSQRSTLLWVVPDASIGVAHIEVAARDCEVVLTACGYGQLVERLREDPTVVVGVEIGDLPDLGLAIVAQARKQIPGGVILVASHDSGVNLIRAAFQAGATDVITLPINPQELHKSLIKAVTHATTASNSETAASGQVITILGSRGGLGVTTLAVNLAVQLGKLTQSNVALADFDLQRGDCAAFLNMSPSQSIATMAANGNEVDDLLLFSSLIRHGSGLSLLAAPQHIEEADLVSPEHAEAAVERLRARFRFTVIDTARTLTGATAGALVHTDRVLLATDLSLPGVRSAHRLVGVLRGLNVARESLDLVIVQGEHDIVPLPDAVRAIGKDPIATLPRDSSAAAAAMNAGAPMNGPKPSPLLLAIIELASKLSGVQASAPAKRGLFMQFLSRGGNA